MTGVGQGTSEETPKIRAEASVWMVEKQSKEICTHRPQFHPITRALLFLIDAPIRDLVLSCCVPTSKPLCVSHAGAPDFLHQQQAR